MIVLYSEIKNIINYDKSIRFKCSNLKTNKIKQVVKQIKLLNLCKQNVKVKVNRTDVINWKVCSGNDLISYKFDEVVLQDSIFNELPPQSDLYAGCVEATMNVMRHAYIENQRKIPVSLEKETWWCFTQIKDKKLHMVVCDLGVSIPYTLPTSKPKLMRLIKIFVGSKITDSDLLEGAIGSPTSRSKEDYRGNGLPKIAEIARVEGGSLAIYSRKGHVHYEGKQKKPIKHDHKTPLLGTVIAWALPLTGGKNENNINSK